MVSHRKHDCTAHFPGGKAGPFSGRVKMAGLLGAWVIVARAGMVGPSAAESRGMLVRGEETRTARAGEAIRYRGDRPHRLVNTGTSDVHAHMTLVLKTP